MTPGTDLVAYKTPLHEMTHSTPTALWNDSASIRELTYSIEHVSARADKRRSTERSPIRESSENS